MKCKRLTVGINNDKHVIIYDNNQQIITINEIQAKEITLGDNIVIIQSVENDIFIYSILIKKLTKFSDYFKY